MENENQALRRKLQRYLYCALAVFLACMAIFSWLHQHGIISSQQLQNYGELLIGLLFLLDAYASIKTGITTKGADIYTSPKIYYFDVILTSVGSVALILKAIIQLIN